MKICPACQARHSDIGWRCPQCGARPPAAGGVLSFATPDPTQSAPYDSSAYARLIEVEAGYFWFRHRARLALQALRRWFPAARDFCEVGCGTGYMLSRISTGLPMLNCTATEIFVEGLAYAGKRCPAATLLQADATHLPFEAEFDVIGAFDVIEHIAEDVRALLEFHRALRPGGGLLLTVPQHPWLWSAADKRAGHQRRYTRAELRDKVRRAGFTIIRDTSFVSLLLPLIALSRRKQVREPADPMREFRISPWLNRALLAVLNVERWLILLGLRMPAGGSLLLVARKEPA